MPTPRILLISLLTTVLICSGALAAPSNNRDRLKAIAGRLLENHHRLNDIYRDMHQYAQFTMYQSDRQLDYIQKSYLFINEANTIAYYQWELLSIFDYIRDDHVSDYATLRYRDLRQAIDDSKTTVYLLNLYVGFIEKPEIQNSIREAVGLIEANGYMFRELRDLLRPMGNKPKIPYEIE